MISTPAKNKIVTFAKLSPSPSEAGLSKLYNHSGTATANRHRQPPDHQKAHF